MAVIMNDAAYMGFPLSIKRGNPAPVDTTAVWYSKTELEAYAKSGATAYVGQILTLVADNKCEAFMISNEAGTLIKLAQTTASGDLAHDVATLQGQVTDLISKVGVEAGTDTEATGLYKEIADVLAVANGKVGSVKATDASVVIGGTPTAPTVGIQVSKGEGNALTLEADGLKVLVPDVTHPEYSVVADKNPGSFSAVYHLTKDGANVGAAINIPKDMVVESGTVETKAEAGAWGEAGTYLHLVLANADEDNIYINVGELIEYVTSGSKVGDQIVIDVSADHKVTATLTDGSVTLAQLHADVQSAIGKAHSHTNKAELDKIVTGDKAKWDAAEQKAHEHDNKTILDTISRDKVDAWDGAVAKQHEHANKTVLDGISAEKVADWDSKAAGNHEHDITELKQASGYIVFNCGSASVNI